MAKLRIEIPVRQFDNKKADELCDVFSGVSVSWLFCQKESVFYAKCNITEKLGTTYKHQIMAIRKLMKIMPDNDSLKADLAKCEEKARNDKIYDVVISFEGEISAEIDISHNSILHYTGPVSPEIPQKDILKLKKLIRSDPLDDFYEEKIKKFLISLIMACVLTAPGIHLGCGYMVLWIDDKKYHSETFLESPLHTEAFSKHGQIMQTKLNYVQTFSWIKKYAKLQENSQKPPVPFTMLTYLFNRDSHESLLYSVIGLESLYSEKSGGISYALQKRINYIFPSITKEQIKNIYSHRSDVVHGKIKMNMCKNYSDMTNSDWQLDDAAILACALLMETIRILIENDATKISFKESLSHKFI